MADQQKIEEPGQVFTNLAGRFRVAIVTDNTAYFGNLAGVPAANIALELKAGKPVNSVINSMVSIPFKEVLWLSMDEKTASLRVMGDASQNGDAKLSFATRADRDGFFAAMRTCLGASHDKRRVAYSPLRAAWLPLSFLILVAIFTILIAPGAGHYSSGGGSHQTENELTLLFTLTVDFLGPIGTIGLGCLIGIVIAIWAFFRMRDPPIMVYLEQKEKR